MIHIQGCEAPALTAESAQQSGPCDVPEELEKSQAARLYMLKMLAW